MQKVLRYGSLGIAATFLMTACAPAMTVPPTDGPSKNGPQAPAFGEALADDAAPAFPENVTPLQMAPEAPQSPVSVGDRGLVLPNGGNVNLDQLYEDLPPSIPQDEASEWLSPMPGAIPQGFGQPVPTGLGPDAFGPGGYGAYPGIIPDLLSYNALARCLYFQYMNFWVPYYLIGNAYYPYAYSPYYDVGLRGYYAYPLFYGSGDYCYPYYFLSSRYRYGYLDWEYYWPSYRSKYRHRYDDDFRSYRSRWGSRDFHGWLDNRRRDRKHENWRERAREYRRGDRPNHNPGKGHGNDRGDRPGNHPGKGPDWNNRPGTDRGDRHDRNDRNYGKDRNDRNDRGNRHERPGYQQGKGPDRNPGGGSSYAPGRGQAPDRPERQGNPRQHREGQQGDDGRGRSKGGGEHVKHGGQQQARPHDGRGGQQQARPHEGRGGQQQARQHEGRGGQQQARQHEGRGGQQQARQHDGRGGQQQARQHGGRSGQNQGRQQGSRGRVKPAGVETPEAETTAED